MNADVFNSLFKSQVNFLWILLIKGLADDFSQIKKRTPQWRPLYLHFFYNY